VGLLLMDLDLRPLWFNTEAARTCAVWNFGEREAAALRTRDEFRLPDELAVVCRRLVERYRASPATPPRPQVVTDRTRGLHARIRLYTPHRPETPPGLHLQLDYRRPRGDRHRALSPEALGLLARLSEREREVAMHVREGLSTAEIAAALHRSPLTIKTQLAAIFQKLGVHGRSRAAALLNR
jgi:DNA-binding CsgD family transcriptional regulator